MTLLLPLFFAYTGLQTNVGLLDRPGLWLLTLALIASRSSASSPAPRSRRGSLGTSWRSAALIGTLMNTRGLTELIVLERRAQEGVDLRARCSRRW